MAKTTKFKESMLNWLLNKRSLAFACLLGLVEAIGTYSPAYSQTDTPTVAGRVVCQDSGLPARGARVTLESLDLLRKGTSAANAGSHTEFDSESISTQLDGSFSFQHVSSGKYLIVVEYAGYVMDLGSLTEEEMARPSVKTLQQLEKLPTAITVSATIPSVSTVQLFKGAALSGRIRFDDGSPASRVSVKVLQRQNRDQWGLSAKGVGSQLDMEILTNDEGYSRVSGLRQGDYKVEATLSFTDEVIISQRFMGAASAVAERSRLKLGVYYGDSFRMKDAKAISLVDGEQRDGVDITIPLNKLHHLVAFVSDSASKLPLGCGTVSLEFADDSDVYASIGLARTGRVEFPFVPEADYVVSASGVTARNQDDKCDSASVYSGAQQPIRVQENVDNLSLEVHKK